MQLKNILVPVDFSNCSKNALKIGIDLAKQHGSTVHLMNAIHIPAPQVDVTGGHVMVEPVFEDYEKRAEHEFEQLKIEFEPLNDVTYQTHTLVSVVPEAVLTCIDEQSIDLIVMGTKGNHSTLEKLIGGTSADVVRCARVPVLLVPENVSSLKPGIIGYATDLGEIDDINRLEPLLYFAQMTNAEVQVFYVTKSLEGMSSAKSLQSQKISDYLSTVPHSFHCVEDRKITHGIFEFIETHQLDMLTMYPRKHGLLDRIIKGSVTKTIAMDIHIPLLSIHE